MSFITLKMILNRIFKNYVKTVLNVVDTIADETEREAILTLLSRAHFNYLAYYFACLVNIQLASFVKKDMPHPKLLKQYFFLKTYKLEVLFFVISECSY